MVRGLTADQAGNTHTITKALVIPFWVGIFVILEVVHDMGVEVVVVVVLQRIGLRAGNRSDFGGNEHNIDGF